MKNGVVIEISAEELLRLKAIQLDDDEKDALAVVKLFLSRIETAARKGMTTPLNHSSRS